MIAATGSAIRAAAQSLDQSQASAQDSPFAILLAALSTQDIPTGDVSDATAPSGAAAPASPQDDQAGQNGKLLPAAKSNADDHVAQAALAALLNTTATPPPFSPPVPETETAPSTPAATLTANDKSKSAKAGADPQADAAAQLTFAPPPVTDVPSNPARPAPGPDPVMPPESGDKVGSDARTIDVSVADAPTDSVLFAAANDLGAQPAVSGGKADPITEIVDASDDKADPASKAQPEKKSVAPDQAGTDAAPAMIAAAYAGPAAAGQASADQAARPAVTADATQSLSVNMAPGIGAKPAKDVTTSGSLTVAPPDNDDAEEPLSADVPPENASPIAATLTKPAAAPAKSADASAKPIADRQTAFDALQPGSPDKPQMPSAAHGNPSHAMASKADAAAPSDDNVKLLQTDAVPNAVPAAAGATAQAAPTSPPPAAIFDPIMTPHAASVPLSGASPAASLQISSAASDPVPDLNGFAVNIAARSLSGARQFEIRLDPPELGRVDIRLSIDASGKAVAHMATDQPQTLDLLRNDAPALTQALRDAGLDVSQNGLNFSLRGQDRQSGDNQNGPQGRKSNLSARLAIQAVQAPAAFAYAGAASNARLDIHV